MDQALNSQKTPHTSPLRASYGMSFVSILMKNDRVIKGFYCNGWTWTHHWLKIKPRDLSVHRLNSWTIIIVIVIVIIVIIIIVIIIIIIDYYYHCCY